MRTSEDPESLHPANRLCTTSQWGVSPLSEREGRKGKSEVVLELVQAIEALQDNLEGDPLALHYYVGDESDMTCQSMDVIEGGRLGRIGRGIKRRSREQDGESTGGAESKTGNQQEEQRARRGIQRRSRERAGNQRRSR
jgi:hypothetical protein